MVDPTKDGLSDASRAEEERERAVSRDQRSEALTFFGCIGAGAVVAALSMYAGADMKLAGVLGGTTTVISVFAFLSGPKRAE